MTKPKHPTIRSLRQGQTVYCVVDDSFLTRKKLPKYIIKYHMHSHKTSLPPGGQINYNLPVSTLRKCIELGRINPKNWYYSRKLAENACI